MTHSEIRDEVGRPQLTPDVIDDFVTWLHSEGVRLDNFRVYSTTEKRVLFSEFWQQYPAENKNFKIDFPND